MANYKGPGLGAKAFPPTGALLLAAATWGVMWYPYRLLARAGLPGLPATVGTYAVALVLGLVVWGRGLGRPFWPRGQGGWLAAMALSGALCNTGYVLATLSGPVMRVMLLFYLAPLWTVGLSRWLLGERLSRAGWGVVALSLAGAVVMLWRPELGWPWPARWEEWMGLGCGFCFALSNVLSRKVARVPVQVRTLALFAGVLLVGLGALALPAGIFPGSAVAPWTPALALGVVGVGLAILLANGAVQYGMALTPANRAIVIMLTELVFAALGAWFLAGEGLAAREWLGGTLVALASLLSARTEPEGEGSSGRA